MIVAITGASGVNFAVKLLEALKNHNIETDLIISENAKDVIELETDFAIDRIQNLATRCHSENDLTAPPSSGSYKFESMIIIPCSMKTLSAIAHGFADTLITRAADVSLKEKRQLILAVRESPFNAIHLENMLKLAKLGVIIAPPIPSYYIKPKSIEELNENIVGRILDLVGIDSNIKRWGEF
ncbi:MAG: Flavin prenyltransferase UbiX [Promethearchaeota archaeon]|nr:MAG: Flavin prenyltransferase UbiX [Candidatus Lokiarchaeota archaeon]